MATLTAWETRVREMLGNPSTTTLPQADLQGHVRAAVRKFSQDRPRTLFADYPGNGSAFDLTVPTGWTNGFSSVQQVEYPQGNRPRDVLDMAEVSLYPEDSAPTHIRLNQTTPTSGKTARVYYSVPWPIPTATASDDKVADTDFDPVASLAAHYAALELAGKAAGHKNPTIPQADAMDWENETERWRSVARDRLKDYQSHVGSADGPGPAGGVTDWDAASSWTDVGKRFLFRGRR